MVTPVVTQSYPAAAGKKSSSNLGSTENPIQLVQEGNSFRSLQPLTPDQLKHIASVLKQNKQVRFDRTRFCIFKMTRTTFSLTDNGLFYQIRILSGDSGRSQCGRWLIAPFSCIPVIVDFVICRQQAPRCIRRCNKHSHRLPCRHSR